MFNRPTYLVFALYAILLMGQFSIVARAQHLGSELVLRVNHPCLMCAPLGSYFIDLYADGFVNYECSSRQVRMKHGYFVSKQRVDSLVQAFLSNGVFSWRDSYPPLADTGRHVVDIGSHSSVTEITFWNGSNSKYIRYDRWPPPALPDLVASLTRLVDIKQWWPDGMCWHPPIEADTTKH